MDKRTEIGLVKDAIHNCRACSLRGDFTPVAFSGHTSPLVTVVGVGPGKRELEIGVPWAGKTGSYLKGILRKLDFPLHKIAWMNVVCCGDRPKQQHIDACRLHARRQLQALEAPFTLVCGLEATNALLGIPDVRLRDIRGRWYTSPTKGWAMSVTHPAAILHAKGAASLESELVNDLEVFRNAAIYGDLFKPKFSHFCLRCPKIAVYFNQGVGFCKSHVPPVKRPKAMFEQLSLLE